jgi:hypothetical protein
LDPQESATLDVAVSGGACGHEMARNAAEHVAATIAVCRFAALLDPVKSSGTRR